MSSSDFQNKKTYVFVSEDIREWLETIVKKYSAGGMDESTTTYVHSVLAGEDKLLLTHYNALHAFGRPGNSESIFRPAIEIELKSLGSYLF